MRIGIFGGSFDPVHCGHLTLAESCRAQAQLDRIWFVPAAHQPFKPDGPFASDADRVAMLKLALVDFRDAEISTLEIDRGGMSFMIDTLLTVENLLPDAKYFLLLGADSLVDFSYWRRPTDICRVATPLIVNRAGEPQPNFEHLEQIVSAERLAEIEASQVVMPPMAISSTEIRRLVAAGGDWQEMVPVEVGQYICSHQLYVEKR
jgi:nicotinate-nucleotide adenylyltransferase